ncbi:hypothetical protein ABK040_008688 [Willaertia magna]
MSIHSSPNFIPIENVQILSFSTLSLLTDNATNHTNHTEEANTDSTTLLTAKLVTLFFVLFASIGASIIPIILSRVEYFRKKISEEKLSLVIDQCNGFAGGVLIGAGFLHLLAEGSEVLTEGLTDLLGEDASFPKYPFGLFLMCIAILLLYFMEFVFLALLASWIKGDDGHHHHHHGHHHAHHHESLASQDVNKKQQQVIQGKDNSLTQQQQQNSMVVATPVVHASVDTFVSSPATTPIESIDNRENKDDIDLELQEEIPKPQEQPQEAVSKVNEQIHASTHVEHTCAHVEATALLFEDNAKSGVPKLLTAFVLWFALSIHSIFLGLGFGAQTDVANMWGVFAAIISHQLIEAFSLGSMVEKGCKKIWAAILLIITYSLAVPIGIAIGMIVLAAIGTTSEDDHHSGEADDHSGHDHTGGIKNPSWLVTQGVFMVLAAGAFVYVALLEIAIHQPVKKVLKISRFLLMVLGFALMAILKIWV